MCKLFISHSSQDDAFVGNLRAALKDHGQDGWIDSRELRGGDPLWEEIQKAIEEASAYAVVISPNSFQSDWVGEELAHALKVQQELGRNKYPVIPLALNNTKLGIFKQLFGYEPLYISVTGDAGGIEAAMNAILVALGKRLPAEVAPTDQPKVEPLEELVLELTDLKFHEENGVRRASARARLVYEPATPGQPEVRSKQNWRFIAPIGPIEAEELRWYLEKYAIWPSHYFRDRARKVEENLVKWGRLLHEAAMPVVHTANVKEAWARIGDHVGRRFSVYVDTTLEDGMPENDAKSAKESGTLLLALPWELLHDGASYLFQGGKPVRVRRRLPNLNVLDVTVVETPIRILLVTARPEDDSCRYIDHRASALPLVEAMESLPGLVKLHVLSPPTLTALRDELDRARSVKKPYHVVHFDGHGVFNRELGLGALCLENPDDIEKLEKRGHITVFTNELGPLLLNHRIPLVFLEACQTAQAEKASESVASELLKVGVASVVAMSHSVLVETARRFVEAFYEALADGNRVGDAMLAGQRQLKDDTFRGRIFGAGELHIDDWFVPVLYQEKDDPQLFKTSPAKQTQEDFRTSLATRLGDLPVPPETGFIGRSRELLALQRLLRHERYAVIRGQGGEGKTALATEFARWMVRSQQIHRAAFVSVETHGNLRAVVDSLGKQLVKKGFSAAGDLEVAIQELERTLREQQSLVVIDNMESVLLPPFMEEETPEALSEEAREELTAILALGQRLLMSGDMRIIFTSREALPAPFDSERYRRELHQLDREDAVKLVERVLNVAGGNAGSSSDATREEIEQLVDAVNCHARTLALMAPSLRERGLESTRDSLIELMAQMDHKFPGSREKSVFASVELSLRRMSEKNRERANIFAVFHGGAQLGMLGIMMQWEEADVTSLAHELIETGLGTQEHYRYLALNPALCPYLRAQMNAIERESLTIRWITEMCRYAEFLREQQIRNSEVAATLTELELPNLFALLDLVQRTGTAEATIELSTLLLSLLRFAGKPRLLERISEVRDAAAAMLDDTSSHAQFEIARTRIEQQLARGELSDALVGAQQLLSRVSVLSPTSYPEVVFDQAGADLLLGQSLRITGQSDRALPVLADALKLCDEIAEVSGQLTADRMFVACVYEMANCLILLGRLEEAAEAYEEAIRRDEKLGDHRGVAASKGQLGLVRMRQHRYGEALKAYEEARQRFTKLDEPGSVAISWHQIGMAYQKAGEPEAAEDAYRKSLAIKVRLKDVAGQASTLGQLGSLYNNALNRPEEAVALCRQAADIYVEIGDPPKESVVRNSLASALLSLGRVDEARQEILRAINLDSEYGHASEPWISWAILAIIETVARDAQAAQMARGKAIASYLCYRRDGGENQTRQGRLSLAVIQGIVGGEGATVAISLEQLGANPDLQSGELTFIRALEAIVSGSRDRNLANAPDLDYIMAAEILFLIETLEKSP